MFLTLGAWEAEGIRFEIASRRKLDSRVVVPYFRDASGELFVGLLERERAARSLRGEPVRGLETIGFDFKGVDETADLLAYGETMFGARTQLRLDPSALQLALPSYARSIGYLTELSLPLLAPVLPPPAVELPVEWDGEQHRIVFVPARTAAGRSEDVTLLARALWPLPPRRWEGSAQLPADSSWSNDQIAAFVQRPADRGQLRRLAGPVEPRFLELSQLGKWEIVTPGTGVSLALLPYVVSQGEPHFLLWHETRVAALERAEHAPLYDLPLPARYLNATAAYVQPQADLKAEAAGMVERLLGARLQSFELLGSGEPSPGTSSELRHRAAVELSGLPARLPDDAVLVSARELCAAVADGRVRDPVIVTGLLQLGFDPFRALRDGDPGRRDAYLRAMTQGSVVQRRLQSYSSIEGEQLQSRTYARLMTLLQHQYGVRIAYPKTEKDREFFKAAFRVFMAADRGENRGLQGLHWSHDAYHFALGNFAAPALADFEQWYASGAPPPPEQPPSGPEWEVYSRALKAAENEATFFSFWTLYAEHEPLKLHVGKLTYWEALRDLGITERAPAREIYDAVVDRAELPAHVSSHPVYQARPELQSLFKYMLGFRPYHFKDIEVAWRFAQKEPYRGYTARFGIYESDLAKYLEHVRTFQERLAQTPPGFNPLLAAWAETRLDLHLRVWDVIKALKLLRKPARSNHERRGFLNLGEQLIAELQGLRKRLQPLRERITDAEITARNEQTFTAIHALGAEIEAVRQRLWDQVAATGLLEPSVVAAERTRELPR